MSIQEERDQIRLMEMLEALALTSKNREIGERYLAEHGEEALLNQAEKQDFSTLEEKGKKAAKEYAGHLRKREKKKEEEAYIRFIFAVGGSTCFYVLTDIYEFWYRYGENKERSLKKILGSAKAAAVLAEALAWNERWMNNNRLLVMAGGESREILKEAISYSQNQYDNGKILLAACYLNKAGKKEKQGLLSGIGRLLGGKEESREVRLLLDNFIHSQKALFGSSLSKEEDEALKKYVLDGKETEPLPHIVKMMLKAHRPGNYMIRLFGGCAFLSMDSDSRIRAFLHIIQEVAGEEFWSAAREMSGDAYFQSHAKILETMMEGSRTGYILWTARWYRTSKELARMSAEKPEDYKEALARADVDLFPALMEQLKRGNSTLYREMESGASNGMQEKIADAVTGNFPSGKKEAKDYLLGRTEISAIDPFVKGYQGTYPNWYSGKLLTDYRSTAGEDRFFKRSVLLFSLALYGGQLNRIFPMDEKQEEKNKKNFSHLRTVWAEEQLPIGDQLAALGAIYNSFYSETRKTAFRNMTVDLLARSGQIDETGMVAASRTGNADARYYSISWMAAKGDTYKQELLECAQDSSKQIRELLCAVYGVRKDWEPEILSMLQSRKAAERELSVSVLCLWGADNYENALKEALEKEKSKKTADAIRAALSLSTEEQQESLPLTAEEKIEKLLKGGKKRKLQWAFETPFCPVLKKDGTVASKEMLQALLTCYGDMAVPGVNQEAASLAEELSDKDLESFMGQLFDKWLAGGAEAKKKWVLYAAAVHGGDSIVPVLLHWINEWPKNARGAMGAEAVKALALNGSSQALMAVDGISRKFKFKQIKKAAEEALDFAAGQLGLSREELSDKIVPDFGFNEQMERIFDYGSRRFRVYLSPALELEIFDGDGKKLKNMPAPGKRDEEEKAAESYEAFKQMKKQIKAAVAGQKMRLEHALSVERQWKAENWKALFVKNPVMHQFAIGLIWGIYEDGRLAETFRYLEDGSFSTSEEEEFMLPETGMVGLVHPVELSEEVKKTWEEQLSDYEIIQPIEQLNRPVYKVTKEETDQKELERFGGKLINGLSLSGKLLGMGWFRGSVEDAGVYYTFYREDEGLSTGVELSFSGAYVGDENEEVTVYTAKFYQAGTVKRGSYVYDKIKPQNLYSLGQVNPRYFSEIVYQLEKATASSKEMMENWKKNR